MNSKKATREEIKRKERRQMKNEQQGDILLLVRNFTWTVDPLNQEVWPNKIPAPTRKARNDLSSFNCQFKMPPKNFKDQIKEK